MTSVQLLQLAVCVLVLVLIPVGVLIWFTRQEATTERPVNVVPLANQPRVHAGEPHTLLLHGHDGRLLHEVHTRRPAVPDTWSYAGVEYRRVGNMGGMHVYKPVTTR
jgi:hypothetical protein